MNTEQILKVLKNERECIKAVRTDECVKDCRTCRYYNTDPDRLEVYDFLINGYEMLQNEGAESYTIRFIPQTEEPLTEFDATPSSGDFKTVAHNRKFDAKESLKANFGIKQPGKVMAEFWRKGKTE